MSRPRESPTGSLEGPGEGRDPGEPEPVGPAATETTSPETTPDGRFVIVDGRRWRASDPSIPDALRSELVHELMDARRGVRRDPTTARPRVQDAKVALGERGEPWWEPTDEGRRVRLAAAIRALLRHRDGSTICPSDAARCVGGEDWRALMPLTREVARELSVAGDIRVTSKGEDVDMAEARGPVRLAPGPRIIPRSADGQSA